ncbi:cysteine hydrolase [Vibrio sinensis]|uniref:Cysteine hydrolase n=1 Tax=Vibrio sinensis TaxID=2302434 RepID=A0A3A6REW4_9VIBR|nr:isochorismatase family cysteine hydrolase [Vibrio sinensis]RJX75221.1 cysteine hydrolase [Vibrio sinensis]
MPITQLDNKTALIVIDLQNGIVALPEKQTVQTIIRNTNQLIAKFHQRNLPVVLVNVSGRPIGRTDLKPTTVTPPLDWSILVTDLIRNNEEIIITKQTWGAFSQDELQSQLQKLKISQVVVVGIATSMGVMSTAMQAYELGYNVTICSDTITDVSETNHLHTLNFVLPKIAEVGTTQDLLQLLNNYSH